MIKKKIVFLINSICVCSIYISSDSEDEVLIISVKRRRHCKDPIIISSDDEPENENKTTSNNIPSTPSHINPSAPVHLSTPHPEPSSSSTFSHIIHTSPPASPLAHLCTRCYSAPPTLSTNSL